MTMCTKTGGDVYLDEYGCYVHCDIFSSPDGDFAVLRTCPDKMNRSCVDRVHGRVENIEDWFDEHKSYGTLIVRGEANWHYYGYDGIDPSEMETY